MTFEEVRVATIVQDVIQELDANIELKKVNWTVGELPSVMGDKSMLRIVMMNLLSNAMKFSSIRQQPHIEIGHTCNDRENIVLVKDNGAGFDPTYSCIMTMNLRVLEWVLPQYNELFTAMAERLGQKET